MEVEIHGMRYKTAKMKINDLREELTRRNASIEGTRKDLQYRLEALIRDDMNNALVQADAHAAGQQDRIDALEATQAAMNTKLDQMMALLLRAPAPITAPATVVAPATTTATTTAPAVVNSTSTPCLQVATGNNPGLSGPVAATGFSTAIQKAMNGEYFSMEYFVPGVTAASNDPHVLIDLGSGVQMKVKDPKCRKLIPRDVWAAAVSNLTSQLAEAGKTDLCASWCKFSSFIHETMAETTFLSDDDKWPIVSDFIESWRRLVETQLHRSGHVYPAQGPNDKDLAVMLMSLRNRMNNAAMSASFRNAGPSRGQTERRYTKGPGQKYDGFRKRSNKPCKWWNQGQQCFYSNCVSDGIFDHRCSKCNSKQHRATACSLQSAAKSA